MLPENVGEPETLAVPVVTLAFPLTALLLKPNTSVCVPALERHSTPGSPLKGSGMSKVPALPCVLREPTVVSCKAGARKVLRTDSTTEVDALFNPVE